MTPRLNSAWTLSKLIRELTDSLNRYGDLRVSFVNSRRKTSNVSQLTVIGLRCYLSQERTTDETHAG